METTRLSFTSFLTTAFDKGLYSTDDIIAFTLPLFKEVLGIHEEGLVAPFENEGTLFINDDGLPHIDENFAHAPRLALSLVEALFPHEKNRHFELVGSSHQLTHASPADGSPAYITGYRCFELLLGHHDPQTDIFCLGLVLASIALGLDLSDADALGEFITVRTNPSALYPQLHPTICRLITEMTELDRSRRSQDLYGIIRRLEHYRDYDPENQTDLSLVAGWIDKEYTERDALILDRLRKRLYDISRRNRLLYYKPNMRFVNLTVSSVPMVLHYQSIRPELLFTWNEELAEKITGMKEIVLNRYLRLEDHAYLPSSLDRIRVESQRDIQEYGFSQLKLVIAFFNWHHLKEFPQERIQSPLLLLPVTLRRNKKFKEDHYILKVADNTAEVNPVLAGQLKDIYGIRLPDFVDLDEMGPEQFYHLVRAQMDEANQGIHLHYVGKPRLQIIHNEASRTIDNYRKKLRKTSEGQINERQVSPLSIPFRHNLQSWKPPGPDIFLQPVPDIFLQPVPPRTGLAEFLINPPQDNPYNWDFDVCHMVLGNFNYKKMSLVRDYNQVLDQRMHHDVFDALFSREPKSFSNQPLEYSAPDDWYHVISADPTQTKAILQSRAGYNYIIQGPPGTGKSQTITNLIADFLARNKNILFVCEKRAALDVVYHRLKQVGLEELCCYIHDSQGDKREFIKNLKATYEDFAQNRLDPDHLIARRKAVLDKMNDQLELLRIFHETSKKPGNETGVDVRELIERLLHLRNQLTTLTPVEEESLPTYQEWKNAAPATSALSNQLEETDANPSFSSHPFSLLQEQILFSQNPRALLHQSLRDALAALEGIVAALETCPINPEYKEDLEKLRGLTQFAVLLYPFARTGHLRVADPDSPEAHQLQQEFLRYQQEQEFLQLAIHKNEHWKDKISPQDLDAAIRLADKHEKSFVGFLNGSWRTLKKEINLRYNFSAHSVRPSGLTLLEQLKTEYAAAAAIEQRRLLLQKSFQLENIDTARISIELLHNKKGTSSLNYLLFHPDAVRLITSLQALHQPLTNLGALLHKCLQVIPSGNISIAQDALLNLKLNEESLGEWLPILRLLAALPPSVKNALRTLPLSVPAIEAVIAWKSLQELYQSNRAFHGADQQALQKAAQLLGEGYTALLEINADLIRATVRRRFVQKLELSTRSASQLTEEEKKLKKLYGEGRKILENEFGKSMRYKSIRELSTKESGLVLKDLKPVWLMSPYSVSDSLPLDYEHFDVVIFDEASQITLEEGVPSLYRSHQTIIVGDEKQMPPTDFFSTRSEDPDDLDKADSAEEEWLSDDADSLLAQGARKLESTLLCWHYRSHFETLISYSNHAFYQAELLTIPDKTIHHREKPAIRVLTADDATEQVNTLFDRSISFHLLPNGLYEKRSNLPEAAYIARLLRQLLLRQTHESIGIVAFSQEQQRAIESALEELADNDPDFSQKLEEAYNRTENDQFTGLIIKNLENIQGDERDIIIMSVCYGPDSHRKMVMNFGPVNKKGGERRLNVLFSRAKKHMAVITSIRYDQITNVYNDGANYLRRFLQYAELISLGQMAVARQILDSLAPNATSSDSAMSATIVRDEIKALLLQLGFEVAEQVGQSGFKCSLAVRLPSEKNQYTLAILIDDQTHYRNKNLVEQYFQRPAILKAFGWKVLPIFAKDWLHHPAKVMDLIKRTLTDTIPVSSFPDDDPAQNPSGLEGLSFQRFRLLEGEIDKFWEIAVDGKKVIVRWGKSGAKGQVQQKTLPSDEAAAGEMQQQIAERKQKGYQPA